LRAGTRLAAFIVGTPGAQAKNDAAARFDGKQRGARRRQVDEEGVGAMSMRKIESNRRYAQVLGWRPSELGASGFNNELVDKVRAIQETLPGLDPDGVFGPLSYQHWLEAGFEAEVQELDQLAGEERVRAAGRLAVMRAKSLWLTGIVDPPDGSSQYDRSRRMIDEFIRGSGGLHWTWERPYEQNGDFEWCGSYVATAWSRVRMAMEWRRTFFASTYRLDRWAQYLPLQDHDNPRHDDQPRRYLRLDENSSPTMARFGDDDSDEFADPQPGDLLLVGGERTGYGKHIAMVERWDADAGRFITLEGNATGAGVRGQRIHGVIRTTRRVGLDRGDPPTVYHARRLIRPSVHDLSG
jgi:hypothetical protein